MEILIVDANVLIDFCKTEKAILELVTRHVANVHVAEDVLAQVAELDRAGAEALGINVLTVEYAILSSAAQASANSPLEFEDWVSLLVAKDAGWTCVTNDKRMRTECEAHGVTVLWGLQLLLRLIQHRKMTTAKAIEAAEAIVAINRRIPASVLAAFKRKAKGER